MFDWDELDQLDPVDEAEAERPAEAAESAASAARPPIGGPKADVEQPTGAAVNAASGPARPHAGKLETSSERPDEAVGHAASVAGPRAGEAGAPAAAQDVCKRPASLVGHVASAAGPSTGEAGAPTAAQVCDATTPAEAHAVHWVPGVGHAAVGQGPATRASAEEGDVESVASGPRFLEPSDDEEEEELLRQAVPEEDREELCHLAAAVQLLREEGAPEGELRDLEKKIEHLSPCAQGTPAAAVSEADASTMVVEAPVAGAALPAAPGQRWEALHDVVLQDTEAKNSCAVGNVPKGAKVQVIEVGISSRVRVKYAGSFVGWLSLTKDTGQPLLRPLQAQPLKQGRVVVSTVQGAERPAIVPAAPPAAKSMASTPHQQPAAMVKAAVPSPMGVSEPPLGTVAQRGDMYVTLGRVVMRQGVELSSPQLGLLPPGTRLLVIQAQGRRFQVRPVAPPRTIGWVSVAKQSGELLLQRSVLDAVKEDRPRVFDQPSAGSSSPRAAPRCAAADAGAGLRPQPAAGPFGAYVPISLPPATGTSQQPAGVLSAACYKCDKCDGPHPTDQCPHFKGGRDNHKDAWQYYGKNGGDPHSMGARSANFVLRDARVERQPGDGSCLFHSMSCGLGDGFSGHLLRREIARYMEDHPRLEIAGNTLEDWVKWEAQISLQEYAEQMRTGSWGGGIEMATLSLMRKVNVHVYEQRDGAFHRISCFNFAKALKTIHVLYQGRMHYDALITME